MDENQSMECVCLGLFHPRNSCGVKKPLHVTGRSGRSPTLNQSAAEGFGPSAAAVVRCLSCWKIASDKCWADERLDTLNHWKKIHVLRGI